MYVLISNYKIFMSACVDETPSILNSLCSIYVVIIKFIMFDINIINITDKSQSFVGEKHMAQRNIWSCFPDLGWIVEENTSLIAGYSISRN